MTNITANELKTRGISVVENALKDQGEAVISVRGHDKYVVLDLAKYNKFRDYELEIALLEARADADQGRVKQESVDAHMKRVID